MFSSQTRKRLQSAVRLLFVASSAWFMNTASAAVLQVSGDELIGALGVNVNGTLYNVEFVEGTCAALFSGCDQPSDFAFTTQAEADAASQALLDQVLIDGPQGNFDTQPTLTFGCEPNTQAPYCAPLTPFMLMVNSDGAFVGSSEILNQPTVSGDTITSGFNTVGFDTTSNPFLVYVRFTPTALPEPTTVGLLAIGLAGFGLRRRKRIATRAIFLGR